jgi:hypothetical protein
MNKQDIYIVFMFDTNEDKIKLEFHSAHKSFEGAEMEVYDMFGDGNGVDVSNIDENRYLYSKNNEPYNFIIQKSILYD